jgi:Domain of unknown function (DUF4388)/Type II secretion system (T2SS), protein G
MALEGTIKDFGLADILQLIGIQRKTGHLTLDGGDDTVTVKFLDGAVVGADTRQRNLEDLLGSVLVRTGRISETQLQEALRIQKSTLQRLGYILVKQDFISEGDLQDALHVQVTQIVYRLFRWRDGKYQFAPADHMEYDSEHFQPLAAETILMEGARMIDEWPIIERRIKSSKMVFRKTVAGSALDVPITSLLDADIDFEFQKDPSDKTSSGSLKISPEERDILHMVDGTSTVQDIVDTTPMGEFDVYRLLYELATRSLIEEVKVSAAASAAAAAEADTVQRWIAIALQVVVFALAAFGAAGLRSNPLTPWRLASGSSETELLKTYASRSRVERLERALQIYYLDRGTMPQTLSGLAAEGFLAPADVVDPWGRPYEYRIDASGYEISGSGPPGGQPDDLDVRHTFSASQRMVLEGGAVERDRPSAP